MRTGFFGGSFDPPHRGHLAVAQAAQRVFSLDRVLLAPVATQPLKPGAAASFPDRLAMVDLLCGGEPGCEASALDGPRADRQPNFTIDALATLRAQELPADAGQDIYVIVGADAFLDLRRWRSPEELLAGAKWIVLARPGFDLGRLDDVRLSPRQRARVHVLEELDDPASATEIRARLQEGDECKGLITPAVLGYIRAHHLYGT